MQQLSCDNNLNGPFEDVCIYSSKNGFSPKKLCLTTAKLNMDEVKSFSRRLSGITLGKGMLISGSYAIITTRVCG